MGDIRWISGEKREKVMEWGVEREEDGRREEVRS